MRTKKKFISMSLVLVILAASMAGCGGAAPAAPGGAAPAAPGGAAPDASAPAPISVVASHTAAIDSPVDMFWIRLIELIDERLPGQFDITLFPNLQLGPDSEVLVATSQGNIHMSTVTIAPIANIAPALNAFELPFAFSTFEEVYEMQATAAARAILDTLESANLFGAGFADNGFRNLTVNRPVHYPEDLRGVTIRTMENEVHMALWSSLGANPTPMTFSEVYTALEQGVIDAQENPVMIISDFMFYEVLDYMVMTNHVYTGYVTLFNLDFWNSLTDEQREVMMECVIEATAFHHEMVAYMDQIYFDNIIAGGMTAIWLTPEQRQEFIRLTYEGGVYDIIRNRAGAEFFDALVQEIGFFPGELVR